MAPTSSYSQKLRDPRWQKKRLIIMDRDKFTCCNCGESEQTLNVHHCYYEAGREPWDYPEASLITLCESCHESETAYAADAKRNFIKLLCQKGFMAEDFIDLSVKFLNLDLGAIKNG